MPVYRYGSNFSVLQRGLTEGLSCMNCALILEEYLRKCKDLNKTVYVAFLDANCGFDVVSHDSLLHMTVCSIP